MKKAIVLFADGFEEIEALSAVDLMRRGGISVITATINKKNQTAGAHGITILTDCVLGAEIPTDFDAVVLPGGQPGTNHLMADARVLKAIQDYDAAGKLVAAICAAPMVLGKAGILNGRKATCYPGCEGGMTGAVYTKNRVERDGNILTANGPGGAFGFGLALVAALVGEEAAEKAARDAQYPLEQ